MTKLDVDRNKYGKLSGIFGITTNAILGIIKVVIGIMSNSVSIIADAFNSISDATTSILIIIGFRLSSKEPNKKHPYGYARYEYISTFVISIFMTFVGMLFLKESIVKIIKPEDIIINTTTYIILFISILIKTSQVFVYSSFAKKTKSNTLKTNAIDARNDIITTTTILISMIIMSIFEINIDGYLGFAVSIFVIYSSIEILKTSVDPLIGIVPTKSQTKKIIDKILSYEGVYGLHDLVIHNYGVNNDFATVHVEVDSKMDMVEAHDIMDNIERNFKEEMGILLTIHMDPVTVGDKFSDDLKEEITECLKKLNKKISIHDFRIVNGKSHTNIIFDCVIPYELKYTKKEIINHLNSNLKNKQKKYYYVIEMDRSFI